MENLYLISGDDDFEKNKCLEEIKNNFGELKKGINYVQIEKDNFNLLEQELTTYSFFQEPKLVFVKLQKKSNEDGESKTKKEWFTEDLEEKILNKIENITLVFWEEGTSKGKLNKFITKNGKILLCEKKKPQQLVTWVGEFCKENNLKIDKLDAAYLIEVAGSDRQVLSNEILKLMDFVDDGIIKKEDIDKLCVKTSEIIIFDLTDSYGKKDIKATLKNLEELLSNKEPLQKILIMLTKHFKSLLLAKIAVNQGRNVAMELGISPYPARKYSEQSRNYTKNELLQIFEDLAKLDADSKVGKIDLKIGLQKIMMR